MVHLKYFNEFWPASQRKAASRMCVLYNGALYWAITDITCQWLWQMQAYIYAIQWFITSLLSWSINVHQQQNNYWYTHPHTVCSIYIYEQVAEAFITCGYTPGTETLDSIPHLPCSARCVPSSFSLVLLAAQSSNKIPRRLLMACSQSTLSFSAAFSSSALSASASKCCTTDLDTFSPTFLFQPKEAILSVKEESWRTLLCPVRPTMQKLKW